MGYLFVELWNLWQLFLHCLHDFYRPMQLATVNGDQTLKSNCSVTRCALSCSTTVWRLKSNCITTLTPNVNPTPTQHKNTILGSGYQHVGIGKAEWKCWVKENNTKTRQIIDNGIVSRTFNLKMMLHSCCPHFTFALCVVKTLSGLKTLSGITRFYTT